MIYVTLPFISTYQFFLESSSRLSWWIFIGIVLPLGDCNTTIRTIGWLGGISASLTTSLFLFRVNGVYHNSTPAKIYFICMWIVAAAGLMVFPLSLNSQPAQPDELCVVESIKKFGVASVIVVAIFDWATFWCISLCMVRAYTPKARWWKKCKIFITGSGISIIPRLLLRTGHLYIV